MLIVDNMLAGILQTYFVEIQILIGLFFGGMALYSRNNRGSLFRLKESERLKRKGLTHYAGEPWKPSAQEQASTKQEAAKQSALLLEGFRMGPPHVMLGISPRSSRKQIERAFRDMMKRYHPDKVARPGTPQWDEAQNIATLLNEARSTMIQGLKQRA